MAIKFDAEAFAKANPLILEEEFDAEAFAATAPYEGSPDPGYPAPDPDIGGTSPPFSDISGGEVPDSTFEIGAVESEEDAFSNLIQGTALEPETPRERKRGPGDISSTGPIMPRKKTRGPSGVSTGPITPRIRARGDEAKDTYGLEEHLKAGFKETVARNKVVDAVERLEASEDFMREVPGQFNVPGMPQELQSDLLFDEIYSRPEEFKQEQQDAAMKLLGEADALLAEADPVKFSPSVEKALRSETFTGAWGHFTENPIDFILEVSARSGAGMAQSLATGVAGAAAGGPVGFAIGTGVGSGNVEFAASVLEGLKTAGIDINDRTSILQFVSDEESMEALYDHAYTRAGIIGTVDALTAGVATKMVTPVTGLLKKVGVESSKAAKIADNLVSQSVIQAAGGGGGETAAQLATTGELKPGEILAETAGEFITAPIDVGAAVISAGKSPTKTELKVDLSELNDPEGLLNIGDTPEEGLIETGIIILDGDTVIDVIPDEDVTVLAGVEERADDKKVPMFDEDGNFIDYGKKDYLSTRFETETAAPADPTVADKPVQATEKQLMNWLLDAGSKLQNVIDGLKADQFTAQGKPRKISFGDSSDASAEIDSYESDLQKITKLYNQLEQGLTIDQTDVGEIRGDIDGSIKTSEIDVSVPYIPMDIRMATLREKQGKGLEYDDRYGEFPFPQTREARKEAPATPTVEEPKIKTKRIKVDGDYPINRLEVDGEVRYYQKMDDFGGSPDWHRVDEQGNPVNAETGELITGLSNDMAFIGKSLTDVKAKMVDDAKAKRASEPKREARKEVPATTEEAIKKNPLYNKLKDAGIEPTPESVARATLVEQTVNESNKGKDIEDWNPGWNYVPMFDENPASKKLIEYDERPTSEFRGKDPIRREKILRPFLKALDIPLFEGNIAGTRGPGKGSVLGYYRTGKNLIRIRNNSDLEVTAHEIGHLIDYKFPEIKAFYTAKRFPDEMTKLQYGRTERALADKDPFFVGPQPLVGPALESISVSYEKALPQEGWAEFHRLYMTQPEEAKRRTPNIYNWYDNWLDTQEIGPAVKKAGREMQAWYRQDPRLRMMSKVGPTQNINDAMNLKNWAQSVRMGMVDDLQGIKRTEINADGSIGYAGPYTTGRLTKGTDSVVLAAIKFGVPVWDKSEGIAKIVKGSEGLQQIFDFASVSPVLPGRNQLGAFMHYMAAVSSMELHQQGRQFRFTDEEMTSVIKDAEKNNPQFEEAFKRYLKWNQGIVDFAVDGGLLSQKEVDGWQRIMYVPMFNIETSGRKTPGRKRLDDAGAGIKRLFGSTANLNPTAENVLSNARMLISATLVNAAKRDFVDFALESDRMGNTLEKLLKQPKTVSVTKEQVAKVIDDVIEEAGLTDEVEADVMRSVLEEYPDFMSFLSFGNQQRGPNVVQIMREGKPVEYEVIDPMAYRSLQLYNKPQQNVLIQMLALPTNVVKRIVVTTPDFLAASLWRDSIGRFFFTRSGQSTIDQLKGNWSALIKDEKYQEFLLNGGGYSSYIASEPQLRKLMRQLNPADTVMGKIGRVLISPYDVFLAVEELSNAMEQGQKVAEFKRLQEQGVPTRAATLAGREMGADFAMAGSNEIFRSYATLIPFLQPALTGMDRMRVGVQEQENRGAVMSKMAAAGGAVAAITAMQLLFFREEYEQLEDWEKRAYVNMFYYDLDGNLQLFRIPKPFDIGVIMSTAEEAAEFAVKMYEGDYDTTEAGKEFGRGVLDSMLSVVTSIPGAPVKTENDEWYEPFLKPVTSVQAFKPFYELGTNKDAFTGAPIETFGEQMLTPALRASRSPFLNALTDYTEGTKAEVSAPVVEHFINSMLAGLGETTLMLLDEAYELRSGIEAPDKKLKDVPGFVFIGDANKPNNRYAKEYYEYANDILDARNNVKARIDDSLVSQVWDKSEKSAKIFADRGGFAGVKIFTEGNKTLSAARKTLNMIYNSPDLSGAEKTERIDEVYKLINEQMRVSVEQYELLLEAQRVEAERERDTTPSSLEE